MKIAIIGAGVTALATAGKLLKKGHKVTIFEKEKFPGGMASTFKNDDWNWPLEKFYHHFFSSDHTLIKYANQFGLANKIIWAKPKTSIFYQNKISRFDSPLTLLVSPHFSITQKLQIGWQTLKLKLASDWTDFEKITAEDYLIKNYGHKAYQILWQPLLKGKFGRNYQSISMTWFWARIKKRTLKLGYFEGGFQTLIDALISEIINHGGKIKNNHQINLLKELSDFDLKIFTISSQTFLKVANLKSSDYKKELLNLRMLGCLNLILVLNQKFLEDNTYWLNINDQNFPFVAIVEHTNFINKSNYNNHHLLYVGGYYPQNHRYFKMKKEDILNEFLPYLKKISPQFNFKFSILNFKLFSSQYAQPIVGLHHAQKIPPSQTPIPGVYLANLEQIYPWDRGINYSLELADKICDEIS